MQHQVKENESFKLMRSLLCSYAPLQYVVLVCYGCKPFLQLQLVPNFNTSREGVCVIKYEVSVGSCPRVLYVSFSCFSGFLEVEWESWEGGWECL